MSPPGDVVRQRVVVPARIRTRTPRNASSSDSHPARLMRTYDTYDFALTLLVAVSAVHVTSTGLERGGRTPPRSVVVCFGLTTERLCSLS